MIGPRVLVLGAWLAAAVTAQPANAQRVELAPRIGYSPPTGTQFRITRMDGTVVRSWDGSGLSIGAIASYWPLTHFGIQGTVDVRLTRAYATNPARFGFIPAGPPIDTSTTQVVASLRLAARKRLRQALQLTAGLGPAMIRFGDSEYGYYGTLYAGFARQTAYGVVGALSVAYVFSSRVHFTLSTEDAVYRVQRKPVALPIVTPGGGTASLEAPLWHQFTVSAAVSMRLL
jgi:hypothetical protein